MTVQSVYVKHQREIKALEDQLQIARQITGQWRRKADGLERLLDRAYPWLHNPYHGTSDFANAAEGDAVIEAVQTAIQHLKEEDDPLVKLPCGSCDGGGCENCNPKNAGCQHGKLDVCRCEIED